MGGIRRQQANISDFTYASLDKNNFVLIWKKCPIRVLICSKPHKETMTRLQCFLVTTYGKRNLARSQPTIDQICFAMEFTLAIGQTVRFAKARGTKAYRWYRKKQVMTETINMWTAKKGETWGDRKRTYAIRSLGSWSMNGLWNYSCGYRQSCPIKLQPQMKADLFSREKG